MKKIALLLAVGMIVTSSTGCGLFRRARSLCNRGAVCTPDTSPIAAATTPVFAGPAQVIVPAPAPCAVPCDPCCEPCCDPCCGPALTSYPTSQPYYDAGCDSCGTMGPAMGVPMEMGVVNGMSGAVPTYSGDPGPLPAGPLRN